MCVTAVTGVFLFSCFNRENLIDGKEAPDSRFVHLAYVAGTD